MKKLTFKTNEISTRSTEDGKRFITGLIPFNSRSEYLSDIGGYEQISPTAFRKTMSDGAPVLALVNHDTSKVLGSTRSGTLKLTETEQGLVCELDVPDTSYARDAYEIISRGDVDTMSFGFRPVKWKDEGQLRTLSEVALKEVSFMVGFPAYQETTSFTRSSYFEERKIDLEEVNNIFGKLENSETLSDLDKTQLKNFVQSVSKLYEEEKAEPQPTQPVTEEKPLISDSQKLALIAEVEAAF